MKKARFFQISLIAIMHLACGEPSTLVPTSPEVRPPGKVKWKLHNFDGKGWITGLALAADGTVWGSVYGNGLVRFDSSGSERLTMKDHGLPSDSILCLTVDHLDNLWAGTSRGLARFDGVEWLVYNERNSPLPSNHVSALAVDASNILWIGFSGEADRGVATFNGKGWQVFSDENSGLTFGYPARIAVDPSNAKWVGMRSTDTASGGLARFDNGTWTAYTPEASGASLPEVQDIAIDNDGNIWLSAQRYLAFGAYIQSALLKFDGSAWQTIRAHPDRFISAICHVPGVEQLWVAELSDPALPAVYYSISIFEAPDWVPLAKLDPYFPQIYVFDIQTDKDNRIWLASTAGVIEVAPLTSLD